MTDRFDVDDELEAVERFIQQVQAGQIGTSDAMAAYRERYRPAIARLRVELEAFQALLDEDAAPAAADVGDDEPDEAEHAAADQAQVLPTDEGGLPR